MTCGVLADDPQPLRRERSRIDRGEVMHGLRGIASIVGQRFHWDKEVSRKRPRIQFVQVPEPQLGSDLPGGCVGLA